MPDQATYLFDNQYHADVIEKAYAKIRATTWDHCVHSQTLLSQFALCGGLMSEFTQDLVRNEREGFPQSAYALFVPVKLLRNRQKYLLEHFVKKKELISLMEILENPNWPDQFICHLSEYVFMNLKIRPTNEGTWLVVPIKEEGSTEGVTENWMETARDNNHNSYYEECRWFIERRPKLSYGFTKSTPFTLIRDGTRVYLDKFQMKHYYAEEKSLEWKLCVSDREEMKDLLRVTRCPLYQDETSGRYYVELTENFSEYIKRAAFYMNCFLYNEANQGGYAITPNYIGPSGYLFTKFDEYIANADGQRLKIAIHNTTTKDWLTVGGKDKRWGTVDEDFVVCGFNKEGYCWIAIPTKDGVSPISPTAFRIWEYDPEYDLIGKMISHDMAVAYPNIYLYKMKSECSYIYIEWFREDVAVKSEYWDITKPYRDYIGFDYYENAENNTLPNVIETFEPYVTKFSVTDMVRQLLLESAHDYRVHEMKNLLNETGLNYSVLYEMIDEKNARYRTHTFRMADNPDLWHNIAIKGGLRIASSTKDLMPYDLYIDGVHIYDTTTYWQDFNQYISFDYRLVKADSVIIVDFYETVSQVAYEIPVKQSMGPSVLPANFRYPEISGSDLIITDATGKRYDLSRVSFGMYGQEFICQVPFAFIDWDELGISPDDPRLADRIGVSADGKFKALTWKVVLPLDLSYVHLLSIDSEKLLTTTDGHLLVHAGQLYQPNPNKPKVLVTYDAVKTDLDGVTSPNNFTKRVRAHDLLVMVSGVGTNQSEVVKVWNSNVYRIAKNKDLDMSPKISFRNFDGADDPNRMLIFINGIMHDDTSYTGTIPQYMETDFEVTLHQKDNTSFASGDKGEMIYLPFPVERHHFQTDEKGWANLAGSGTMCICKNDLVFVNGKRIPYDDIFCLTNQLVFIRGAENASCTIIRLARDSNLYDFQDVSNQSFYDVLFGQSPGYLAYLKAQVEAGNV